MSPEALIQYQRYARAKARAAADKRGEKLGYQGLKAPPPAFARFIAEWYAQKKAEGGEAGERRAAMKTLAETWRGMTLGQKAVSLRMMVSLKHRVTDAP